MFRNGFVAGSVAGSKWISDDLYKRAASTNKKFHVVEGSNHMQLYDVPKYVDEAVSVLAPFFCGFRGKAGMIPGSSRSAFQNEAGHDSGVNPVSDSDFKPFTLGHLSEP